MTDDLLHVLEFVEREEYITEDYPTPVESYTSGTELPVPTKGDVIDFGWWEKDGERVDEIDMEDNTSTDSDAEYTKSEQRYRAVDIDWHFHQNRTRSGPQSLATDRFEINTTVIVIPYEDDD